MAYTTYEFYSQEYKGNSASEAEFPSLCARASDVIDSITGYILRKVSLENLPALTNELVQKATCTEIDYLVQYGLNIVVDGGTASDFTVGKVNISNGNNKSSTSAVAKGALMYLEQTGLLTCVVPVAVEPFAPYPFW